MIRYREREKEKRRENSRRMYDSGGACIWTL